MKSKYIPVIIQLLRGYLSQLWLMITGLKINRFSRLRLGKYSTIQFEGDSPAFILPEKLYIRNFCFIMIGSNASLKMGNGFFMNNYCSITCFESIEIGDHVLFGEGVRLYDHNHQFRKHDLLIKDQGYTSGKIKIGNNCWIGSNSIILKGVTIGDNVVIGANCLIYKSIPANSIVKTNSSLTIDSIIIQ